MSDQWWLITGPGDFLRGAEAVVTKGEFPVANVMRTYPIAHRPDWLVETFDFTTRALVESPALMVESVHRINLARLAEPTMPSRIALGLVSDEERAAFIAALAWKDAPSETSDAR